MTTNTRQGRGVVTEPLQCVESQADCPTVSLRQVLKQVSFGFHVPYIQRLAILEAVRSVKKRKMEEAPEFVVYALFSA
jgi:hypothetical protein